MTVLVLLLTAISAFFIGFCVGVTKKTEVKCVKPLKADCRIEKFTEEFENFLNYDGSEQI